MRIIINILNLSVLIYLKTNMHGEASSLNGFEHKAGVCHSFFGVNKIWVNQIAERLRVYVCLLCEGEKKKEREKEEW